MKFLYQFKKLFISLSILLGINFFGFSQTLNPSSISTNGSVNVIVQDSTTIYIGGNFSAAGYKSSGIAKINSNATSSFEFPSVGGQCYATVPDGNGGWYVGGSFNSQGITNLAHILANNTIDTSFAPNPNNVIYALYFENRVSYLTIFIFK